MCSGAGCGQRSKVQEWCSHLTLEAIHRLRVRTASLGTHLAATQHGMAAEPTAERLPVDVPNPCGRPVNIADRSDGSREESRIERVSMRRLKQQKCKVDGKSPYFRSPTKVGRASLALRLVVLPPDGPRRRPRCIGAARRREIGRRRSLTRFVRDGVTIVTLCNKKCYKHR